MKKLTLLLCLLLLTTIPALAQEGESAYVRAAHFVPDAGVVDVFVDGERTLTGLDFADVSDWMEVPAGTYSIDVVAEGGSAADALLSEDVTVEGSDWATITVIGEASDDSLAFQPIVEQLTDIPEGLSRVGMFHAIATLPPVTVTDDTGRDLVIGLGYPGTFTGSDGYSSVDITAGEYTLTMTDEEDETIAEVGPTVLGEGRYYFFAAIGTGESPTFVFDVTDTEAVISGDMGAMTEADTGTGSLLVRVAHLSPDAPEVDVYINEELTVSDLSYTSVTDFVELDAGIYDVAIVPAGGAPADAVYTEEVALFEDSTTLVAAVGFVEDDSLDVVTALENTEPVGVGLARVAFFQSIRSDALFNLTLDEEPLLAGVTYPEVFEGAGDGYASADIVTGDYSFGIEAADDDIELDAGEVTLGAGRYYLFVSVGTPEAPNYLLIPTDMPE